LPVGDVVPAVVVVDLAVVVVVLEVVEAPPDVQVPKAARQPVPQYWLVVPQ
jgi:hypothetical protein